MSKLRDTPYFKYLSEILNKTDVDSEQWDAINGAMHQMEDQEAENNTLRSTIEGMEESKAELQARFDELVKRYNDPEWVRVRRDELQNIIEESAGNYAISTKHFEDIVNGDWESLTAQEVEG